jgi:hypothetical protein
MVPCWLLSHAAGAPVAPLACAHVLLLLLLLGVAVMVVVVAVSAAVRRPMCAPLLLLWAAAGPTAWMLTHALSVIGGSGQRRDSSAPRGAAICSSGRCGGGAGVLA